MEGELTTVKKHLDYCKKAHFKLSKELKEAHDGKYALEYRIRKALDPCWEEADEEEEQEEEEEEQEEADNSPSPSFVD